ncbi:MAG: hypothetical protein LH461_11010, partial [Spirochaetaceae bacterium]|nr:hypothetical protein [Spirochaetaceae bacterium]
AALLRKGSTNSARGADRFVADALITARKAGASGVLVLRADSAFYGHDVIAAALITVPGRLARSARRLTLHLPCGWPWQTSWEQLATAANSPPLAA